MLIELSENQVKQRHKEMVKWVEEALDGKYGGYVYNFLVHIQHLLEQIVREQVSHEDYSNIWRAGFDSGLKNMKYEEGKKIWEEMRKKEKKGKEVQHG